MLLPPPLPAQDEATYPAPVSEYAEQTGPNTMTFLSYPKYYRNASGNLIEVDTTLVKSTSADWDYEVTTGIWTLRVRSDGNFQAEHEGNVFTYRLNSLGLRRGDSYKPFAWGEPNWSNVSVMGDTIRWTEVFPDVDLSVRYIHDILKVDVILKRALMDRIRADVNNGFLNREEYLTARFDIPNALVTGEARQGGRIRDIFAEPFELNQPLEILKHDKVVHKIRPVETYVIDDQGREIMMDESPIRSAKSSMDISACLPIYSNLGFIGNNDSEIESYLISVVSDHDYFNHEWPILYNDKNWGIHTIPQKSFVIVFDENLKQMNDELLQGKIKSEFGRNDIVIIRDSGQNQTEMRSEILAKAGETTYSPISYRRYQIRSCASTALFHMKSSEGLDILETLCKNPEEDELFRLTLEFHFHILQNHGSLEHYLNQFGEIR